MKKSILNSVSHEIIIFSSRDLFKCGAITVVRVEYSKNICDRKKKKIEMTHSVIVDESSESTLSVNHLSLFFIRNLRDTLMNKRGMK